MPGGRFVFKGQRRKKDEEPREFAAGRSITLSGDTVVAGSYVPFAKHLMGRLEDQFLENGSARHHTIAVHNGTIRFEVSQGRRAIHIDAAGGTPGDWVCFPHAEFERGGWGPPFVDDDPESDTFGEVPNDPMGTGASEEGYLGPPFVKFGLNAANSEWEVKQRAQEQRYATVDWKQVGLPVVTWDSISHRYWPHRENYFPSPRDPNRFDKNDWSTSGQKVWAGERLLFDGLNLAHVTFGGNLPLVAVLGAALRVENAPVWELVGEVPFQNAAKKIPQELAPFVFLVLVVTDGLPLTRSWETWSARVGSFDPATGEVAFFASPGEDNEQPIVRGEDFYNDQLGTGVHRVAKYGDQDIYDNTRSEQRNLEILAKYGQPFYFAQPATKCSTFTVDRVFTVDWGWGGEFFATDLDIGAPEAESGTEPTGGFSEQDDNGQLFWTTDAVYLINNDAPYAVQCPTNAGEIKEAHEAFLDQVLGGDLPVPDGKEWREVSSDSGETNGLQWISWTWEGADRILFGPPWFGTWETTTGRAVRTVTAYQLRTAGTTRIYSEGSSGFFRGTLAVDYEGQTLRKMTVESDRESNGGTTTIVTQSTPSPLCHCRKGTYTGATSSQTYTVSMDGEVVFTQTSSNTSPGGVSTYYTTCPNPSPPPPPANNGVFTQVAWLYADLRGAKELFWWESTGEGLENGINWTDIDDYPGVTHTLKSHIDGTIFTGAS